MRKAFTLIELLVVVAIIALLISILLPALSAAKKQARESVCMSNMRQLALGWIMYSVDENGYLPGSGWDTTLIRGWVGRGRTWCWLGTRADTSGNIRAVERYVPMMGTIFKYVDRNVEVYKCPEDRASSQFVDTQNHINRKKPPYSYTAPVILTGAPLSLLKRTRFADQFEPPFNYARDWDKAFGHSQPWMIVEESETHWLAEAYDSGWSNWDEMATRHRGKGAVNHTDGSAAMRAYQHSTDRQDRRRSMDAWKVYYELTDGRIVTAGTWQLSGNRRPKFGYLKSRDARGLNR